MSDRLGPYLLGPNDTPENGIYTGDCAELMGQIPPASVPLIVTDPPYNKGKNYGVWDDSLEPEVYAAWYKGIADHCFRIMARGYLYVSCTINQLWSLRPIWEDSGFRWLLPCIWWGPNYASSSSSIGPQWRLLYEPVMMFQKGKRLPMLSTSLGTSSDAIMRYTRPQRSYSGELKRIHPTQKPVGLYRNIIARTPGDIILDPFVGSGTVAMAAKMLGRRYLAFEIDPDMAEIARKRVRNTQMPLFHLEPEQGQMELATKEELC